MRGLREMIRWEFEYRQGFGFGFGCGYRIKSLRILGLPILRIWQRV